MSDIADLERRISAALDRIGTGLGGLDAASGAAAAQEAEALREALEAEKTANSQLEARVATLHEQVEQQTAELGAKLRELQSQLDAAKTGAFEARSQVQQLRKTNQHLQGSLAALRQAVEQGVEPHLLNQAMMSELEGLRSVRDADRAELDELIGALGPLVQEVQDA
jgi:chromosome segregation ATPase